MQSTSNGDKSMNSLAKIHGVSKSCICGIKTGRNWAWLTKHDENLILNKFK